MSLSAEHQRAYAAWSRLTDEAQDRAMRFLSHLVREERRHPGRGVHRSVLLAVAGAPPSAWRTLHANVRKALAMSGAAHPEAVIYDRHTDRYRIATDLESLALWCEDRAKSLYGEAELVTQVVAGYIDAGRPEQGRARRLLADARHTREEAQRLRDRARRYGP